MVNQMTHQIWFVCLLKLIHALQRNWKFMRRQSNINDNCKLKSRLHKEWLNGSLTDWVKAVKPFDKLISFWKQISILIRWYFKWKPFFYLYCWLVLIRKFCFAVKKELWMFDSNQAAFYNSPQSFRESLCKLKSVTLTEIWHTLLKMYRR